MIILLSVDFLVGFLLHRLRPWTLQFSRREGDLIRYAIGLFGFLVIAPFNVLVQMRDHRKRCRPGQWLCIYENVAIGMILAAAFYGAGVVIGFLSDGE